MRVSGLFTLVSLFGLFSLLSKHANALASVLHEGVIDSLSYDPNLLSMLQMEQSLDLDDEQAAYFGASLLDRSPNFLQQSSRHLGPENTLRGPSFVQGNDDDLTENDSFLEENSFFDADDADEETEVSFENGYADDEDEEYREEDHYSFLQSKDQDQAAEADLSLDQDQDQAQQQEQSEEQVQDQDQDQNLVDQSENSLLQSSSSSSSADSDDQGEDLGNDDAEEAESFLQTDYYYKQPLGVPNTFGSLIQMHNFEPDPSNFLQDDTMVLLSEEDQNDYDLNEEPKKNSSANVLKSDADVEEAEMSEALEEQFGDRVLAMMQAYKVWLVVITVLLSIAVLVRVFYLDRFLKFRTELYSKMDEMNKNVVNKFNAVFKRNQANAVTEETPLLNA